MISASTIRVFVYLTMRVIPMWNCSSLTFMVRRPWRTGHWYSRRRENVKILLAAFTCRSTERRSWRILFLFLLHYTSYLQHGAFPLIAPHNESYPDTYITTRHNLLAVRFNQTIINPTIQLNHPLIGTWFGMVRGSDPLPAGLHRSVLDLRRPSTI